MNLSFWKSNTNKKLKETIKELNRLSQQQQEASHFINEIEKGNLKIDISEQLSESELGSALLSMKEHLDTITIEEKNRNWFNTALASFSDILRNKNSLNLEDLSDEILKNLVKHVNGNQGAIFVLEEDQSKDQYLEVIACYAYERKKYLNKRIEVGEGLAGQCVLEKEYTYLSEIPADYINITSGLGDAPPRAILITPLIVNDNVYGVLELASLSEFKPYQIDFVNKLAESIASTIKNVKDNERTHLLLRQSQQQSEELRAQEEELRQNMEEMQATQEDMKRKSADLNEATAEMQGVLNGINATMATIEFEPDGTIIKANDNFLKTVKYNLEDIRGKHHKMFAPKDVLDSEEYQKFWSRLAKGESMTGVFKRVSSTGETIWLNAIYNPIRNGEGQIEKVIKFATDITRQQETDAESKGLLHGINATMATIEFKPDGTIVNANENFLKTVKFKLEDIQGKHHKIFAPKDVVESEDYKTFWKRLASGESLTGIFKRKSSTGDIIWLNAIYNPIFNSEGEVIKVVKFATDITKQQEAEAESKGILDGINATMATIEFKPDGTIVNANENFLKTVNYKLQDIKGKHHKMFAPKDVLDSEEYKTFWERLAAGESLTGIFKRVSSEGKTIWLNAIYNPIRNSNGEVVKVVKFATDVTEQQKGN